MLAQQGKLADLVQQHLSVPRKQLNPVNSLVLAPKNTLLNKKQITTTKKKRGRCKSNTKK